MKSMNRVPFFSNLPDDTHCVQAAFRMILKYFLPDRDFSWNELEKMSAKAEGKSTWPAQILINLENMGFDVALIEGFNAEDFIKTGEKYLIREFGEETAAWQSANSDIPQEKKLYQSLLNSSVHYENRIPKMQDIKTYLDKGYLVKITVNSRRLNKKQGYNGHSVVVYDIDDRQITFHDPGLPGQEARVEPINGFEAAWADPNDKAKELIAVKYKG